MPLHSSLGLSTTPRGLLWDCANTRGLFWMPLKNPSISPEGIRGLRPSLLRGCITRAVRKDQQYTLTANLICGIAPSPSSRSAAGAAIIAAASLSRVLPGRCSAPPLPVSCPSPTSDSRGAASACKGPASSGARSLATARASARQLPRCSTNSSSSVSGGGGHGKVWGTVLRTVDPVIAAASATRALVAPLRSGPSAAASAVVGAAGDLSGCLKEPGTYSSIDSSMDESGSGGVRLLVVVGVVLLDDPYWTDGADGPSPASAAAVSDIGDGLGSGSSGGVDAARPVRVLLAQRPVGKANAGLWEFPGGKVDPGETPEAALVRELREELAISVDPTDLQPLTFASHTYATFHLLMPLYACRRWRGEPRGAEGQAVAWATAEEVSSYNLTPADVPLVPAVLAAMRYGGLNQQR